MTGGAVKLTVSHPLCHVESRGRSGVLTAAGRYTQPDESPSIHLAKLPTSWHNFLPLPFPRLLGCRHRRQHCDLQTAAVTEEGEGREGEVGAWRETESIKTNRKQESTWGQSGLCVWSCVFCEDQLEWDIFSWFLHLFFFENLIDSGYVLIWTHTSLNKHPVPHFILSYLLLKLRYQRVKRE